MKVENPKRKAKKRKALPPLVVTTILCHADCPQYRIAHNDAWMVECDCGRQDFACGECLATRRVMSCVACATK